MTPGDNHYEFLGLGMSASPEEIDAAIERLSEQAITVVYSSPQRSADLWERIRRMRRDLLATPEGRQVYDEALVRRQAMEAERAAEPPASSPVPAPLVVTATRIAPRASAPAAVTSRRDRRAIAWPYALAAAAAVFVAVVAALLAHGPASPATTRPQAMTLSQSGAAAGTKFRSGGSVVLRWSRVRGATRYRLQLAVAPGDATDAQLFGANARTLLSSDNHFLLTVTGEQMYYWRVAALIGGRWQHYSPSQHFAVARPQIARPVALAPVNHVGAGGQHVRLCWSPVAGAVGYRLRVQGFAARTVQGTCTSIASPPRRFRWSVAALVRGAQLYAGSYSVAAQFQLSSTRHSRSARKHTGRPVTKSAIRRAHHAGTIRRVRSGVIAAAPRGLPAGKVEVASSRSAEPSASRPLLTGGTASVAPPAYRPSSSAGASTSHRRASTPVVGAGHVAPAGVSRGHAAYPTQPATPAATRVEAPGRPTAPSSTPVQSAAPSPTSPPSAPPPPPASTPVAPTAGPPPTASAAVVVQPAVVQQAAPTQHASTPPSPTSQPPTAAPAPPTQVVPTSPVDSSQHPAHPDHPDHPEHPTHPTHP